MSAFLSWVDDNTGESHSWYFEVCTEEQVEQHSSTTDHPVEEGANVADHVKRELDRVTLEVFVSQAPISDVNRVGAGVESIELKIPPRNSPPPAVIPTPGAAFGAAVGALKSLFGGAPPTYHASVLTFDRDHDFVAEAAEVFEKLRRDVQLVSVVTPSRTLDNMFLESVVQIGNAGTGTGRTFRLGFKEIRKVRVSIVAAPVPTEIRAQPMKKKGAQGPIEAKQPETKKSMMKSAIDAIRGR